MAKKTVCVAGPSVTCAHKRNLDKQHLWCAIEADAAICSFAKQPEVLLRELKAKLGVEVTI